MRTIDFETIFICGVMALGAALGMIAGIVTFMGMTIAECNPAVLSGSYFAVSGLLWGILLLENMGKNKKSKYSGR